jgi:hypothetical protein
VAKTMYGETAQHLRALMNEGTSGGLTDKESSAPRKRSVKVRISSSRNSSRKRKQRARRNDLTRPTNHRQGGLLGNFFSKLATCRAI